MLAAACAAAPAAMAQSSPQAGQRDLVVVTITPYPMSDAQRSESTFRALLHVDDGSAAAGASTDVSRAPLPSKGIDEAWMIPGAQSTVRR
jgi:hypothetical protein